MKNTRELIFYPLGEQGGVMIFVRLTVGGRVVGGWVSGWVSVGEWVGEWMGEWVSGWVGEWVVCGCWSFDVAVGWDNTMEYFWVTRGRETQTARWHPKGAIAMSVLRIRVCKDWFTFTHERGRTNACIATSGTAHTVRSSCLAMKQGSKKVRQRYYFVAHIWNKIHAAIR